jgi:hypothetical protein
LHLLLCVKGLCSLQPFSSKYEAVIQPGNEALVHHIEVFHCEAPSTHMMPDYQGPCFSHERPEVTKVCKRVLAAWAMGALPFSYPEVREQNKKVLASPSPMCLLRECVKFVTEIATVSGGWPAHWRARFQSLHHVRSTLQ